VEQIQAKPDAKHSYRVKPAQIEFRQAAKVAVKHPQKECALQNGDTSNNNVFEDKRGIYFAATSKVVISTETAIES
jgi:hypothetical protein